MKHARIGHNNAGHIPGFRSDRIYGQWNRIANLAGRVKADLAADVEPVISIMMTQDGIRWADVGNGKHDEEIDTMAADFHSFAGSGLIIPQHEPDNMKNRQTVGGGAIDWASYRKAAGRIEARFRAAGIGRSWRFASNTTGWDKSVIVPAVFTGCQMVAGDRYNWAFTYHNPTGSRWNSLENESSSLITSASLVSLPAAIFESNCKEDPNDPGRKALWLHDAFQFVKDAGLRRIIFFEGDPLVNWVLKSSPKATAVVDVAAADPFFAG